MPTSSPPETLILGLGNTLLGDEAVGVEVIRRLEAAGGMARTRLLDGGTLSFPLAGFIAACPRLIVVDASALEAPPGTLAVFENAAMDRQLSRPGGSVHEVSLSDLLDMVRLEQALPCPRALVGIQPARVDWGEFLTPPVAAAVPRAMASIRALVKRWESADRDLVY